MCDNLQQLASDVIHALLNRGVDEKALVFTHDVGGRSGYLLANLVKQSIQDMESVSMVNL